MTFPRQARLLICAVQTLTRLPTPALTRYEPSLAVRAVRYYPLVGQMVGLATGAVMLMASTLWKGWPAAVLALGTGVILTGGFHEDGLADAADGLFGGGTPERRIEIMKDSRIGAFGALALVLILMGKAAALAASPPLAAAAALLAAHGWGRAAAVVALRLAPYAGDPTTAKLTAGLAGVRAQDVLIALGSGLWPFFLMSWPHAVLGLLLSTGAGAAIGLASRRLIGGITGDVLGAVEQAAELGVLLGTAAIFPS